jgi:hypothetical protein
MPGLGGPLFLHQHLPLLTPPHHWMTMRKGMLSLHHVSIAEQLSFFPSSPVNLSNIYLESELPRALSLLPHVNVGVLHTYVGAHYASTAPDQCSIVHESKQLSPVLAM